MHISDILPPELEASSLGDPMRALLSLYEEVEAATSAFREGARGRLGQPGGGLPRFGCPEGCGACCERFMPDILPAEADFAALWILGHRPELAERGRLAGEKPPCPFYDRDSPEAHCSIYPARPLICRLFGYTAVATKNGLHAFSLCWAMPDPSGTGRRSWEGQDLAELLGFEPPLMADFGLRLQSLLPESAATKPFLGPAIASSVSRLSFLLSMARGTDNEGEAR